MPKYINVDDLLKDHAKQPYDPVKYTYEYGFVVKVEDILKAPSIDVPERNVEKLTDSEQRIFLSAIGKEKTLCQNIEKLWDDLHLSSDDDLDLVKVCDEIERKVKKALWT